MKKLTIFALMLLVTSSHEIVAASHEIVTAEEKSEVVSLRNAKLCAVIWQLLSSINIDETLHTIHTKRGPAGCTLGLYLIEKASHIAPLRLFFNYQPQQCGNPAQLIIRHPEKYR